MISAELHGMHGMHDTVPTRAVDNTLGNDGLRPEARGGSLRMGSPRHICTATGLSAADAMTVSGSGRRAEPRS